MQHMRAGWQNVAMLAVGMTTLATPAYAHQVATGLEGFPAHLVHPLLTLHQLLLVLAACALSASRWPHMALLGLAALAIGIAGGWAMQYFLPDALPSYWVVTYAVMLLGALVAALAGIGARLLALPVIVMVGGVFGLDTYNLDLDLSKRVQPPVAFFLSAGTLMVVFSWILTRQSLHWLSTIVRIAMAGIAIYALRMLAVEMQF